MNSEWWLVDREVKSPTPKPDVLGTQVPPKTLRPRHPPVHSFRVDFESGLDGIEESSLEA